MTVLDFGVTISNGSTVFVGQVPAGSLLPTASTLTVGASATAGATSITVTSTASVILQNGYVINFGGAKRAVVKTTGNSDVITVGTSSTVIPVEPIPAALSTSDTAVVYALRRLMGMKQCSVPTTPASDDVSTMDEGFAVTSLPTSITRTVNASGSRKSGDRAMYEVIIPTLNSDTLLRNFLYLQVSLANGDLYEGRARITGGDGVSSADFRQPIAYSLVFTFDGQPNYSNAIEAGRIT